MKKIKFIAILFICTINLVNAGDLLQTIRGTVKDKDSKAAIPGATVLVQGTNPPVVGITGVDGEFVIKNLPVGRISIKISSIGYHEVNINDILLGSGKETMLIINILKYRVSNKICKIRINSFFPTLLDSPISCFPKIREFHKDAL